MRTIRIIIAVLKLLAENYDIIEHLIQTIRQDIEEAKKFKEQKEKFLKEQ